jgi:hypothetical protein
MGLAQTPALRLCVSGNDLGISGFEEHRLDKVQKRTQRRRMDTDARYAKFNLRNF